MLLAAAGLATGLGVYAVRRAFPQTSGRIALEGLHGTVEVMRDRWGIPHIYAQDDLDLFFAQGFVHAQDRLWQMEFNRRAASGRLSEIFGPVTLDTDRFLRTVGLRRAAEAEAAQLGDEMTRVLQAYADGVNAYITSRRGRLPLEFALLRYVPEPWSPVDSVAFGKLMAWTLSGNWDSEILRAHLVSRFGEAGMERLMPAYPAGMPVIVPAGADYRPFRSAVALRLVAHAPARDGTGSNNWVIAGSRTTTGTPILANDPHLQAAMPSIWYEMDLSSERFHAAGATFAGAPGVIIGHNAHIAWGVTNAGPDVQDLYLERFDPDDPTRYEFKGQWEQATVVEESISVKGRREPVLLPVRITRHGPILNGVVDGLDAFVALRWTALEPGTILGSVLRLDEARNWSEFREALKLWTVPAQNFVYADGDGNIGYQLPGRIPVRAKGDGLLPVPGWTGEYEWVGEIPFDELPSSFNPERGYIVTANNRIIPDGYQHFIAAEWDPGFRAQRIEAMLTAQPKVSPEVVADMQLDTTSLPAQAIIRSLQGVQVTEEPDASLLAELRAWDGVLAPESQAAAIYEAFR
ncbi:MAG TPA: penicillin acylase family protein, partial [bacterium]